MRDMGKQVDNSLYIQLPKYSRQNLDSQVLTTTRFGLLTPTYLLETVPGGKYSLSPETLVRFQPLASPLMHKCELKTMYFHVPYRILWKNWEYYIMGKKDPYTGLDPIHPYITANMLRINPGPSGIGYKIPDYFGVKTPSGDPSALEDIRMNPFMYSAYQAIYNRWFRHKLIEDEARFELQDGLVDLSLFGQLMEERIVTFEDDYFNSMLPSPQYGDPAVITNYSVVKQAHPSQFTNSLTGTQVNVNVQSTAGLEFEGEQLEQFKLYAHVNFTVEEIRKAEALQKYLEVSNHVGNYIDFLKAFYNVDFPDNRAQQPEYITGVSTPITISDVMNTADGNQGRVVGNGASYSQGQSKTYDALEHGMIIGLTFVTYKPTYKNAKSRLHFKTDKYDYFNPVFDSLGEQAVLNGELNQIVPDAKDTLGYVPRHFDYRSSFDLVTGEMQNQYMHWHLARNYNPLTGINEDFYKVLDERRIFQVQQQAFDPILIQQYHNVSAYIPMQDIPDPSST